MQRPLAHVNSDNALHVRFTAQQQYTVSQNSNPLFTLEIARSFIEPSLKFPGKYGTLVMLLLVLAADPCHIASRQVRAHVLQTYTDPHPITCHFGYL